MGTAIGFLVGKQIFGKTITEPVARLILTAGLFLAVLGGCAGLIAAYNHHIISASNVKQDAANAKADRKADSKAADQRRVDDARLPQESQQLKEAQSHARTDTERSLARFRCIRLQQAARAANRVVPSCS